MKGGEELTNTKMLADKILKSGLKKAKIAEFIGISRYGFSRKVKNQSQFKPEEIQTLCEILKITDLAEKEAIFFDKVEDKKST